MSNINLYSIYRKCSRKYLLLWLLCVIALSAWGQASPNFEFRGVWIATVNNIDWPSAPGLPVETMKREAIELLDMHKKHGMNAVIFQLRPCSDAFYNSSFEPWSRYLTGIPGRAPANGFDPLTFWIDEAHKRGMELHAWINPYRLAQNASDPIAGNHIAFKNPNWVIKYDNKLFFDPGVPETRTHVVQVIADIVSQYDVDAIHFDDYFYPYPTKEIFPDTASYRKYNRTPEPLPIADWRRENVDVLIKSLSDTIKSLKPWVKFGISPFGVWRNIDSDREGSNTRAGVTNYDHLYADVRKWLREGWIDYVAPQIYWEIGHPLADFETLVQWWNRNTYGRGLIIGLAPYKIDRESGTHAWTDPAQLSKQVDMLRKFSNVQGCAYFSSKHFKRDLMGFQDTLMTRLYREPALVPPMQWLATIKPLPPGKVKVSKRKISWESGKTDPNMQPNRYLVYMNEEGTPALISKPNVQYTPSTSIEFQKKKGKEKRKRKTYEVRVSTLDRINNESKLSEPVTIKL